MNKYKNKYRIPSIRLPHWNYGWNGAYFVTICTHDRQFFFGEIADGQMVLSEIGEIAVTKRARTINPAFAWQRNYYEHIIRDDKSYIRISEYIKNNPQNWRKDDYHDR